MPTNPDRGAAAPARKPGPKPWRAPGSKLGFAEALAQTKQWPPRPAWGKDRPTATPYLVLAAALGDVGARPLPGAEALRSASIEIVDATSGAPVAMPVKGGSYKLRAHITNLGATASYAGLADFYVAPTQVFDAAAHGGPPPVAQGRTGFSVGSQAMVTVVSPHVWAPDDDARAAASIVVHAYDFMLDPLGQPFDARGNRHVARRDDVSDFGGTWNGSVSDGTRTIRMKIVIQQLWPNVTCAFFTQKGGVIPPTPQATGSGTVAGTTAGVATTELNGGDPWATNQNTLTLSDPDTLQVQQTRTFADGRPKMFLSGTLTRTP